MYTDRLEIALRFSRGYPGEVRVLAGFIAIIESLCARSLHEKIPAAGSHQRDLLSTDGVRSCLLAGSWSM